MQKNQEVMNKNQEVMNMLWSLLKWQAKPTGTLLSANPGIAFTLMNGEQIYTRLLELIHEQGNYGLLLFRKIINASYQM